MARRIQHSVAYAYSVADVHAAFTSDRYWRERMAAVGGDGSRLDSVDTGEGTASVAMTQTISSEELPSVVSKIRPGDLEIVRTEQWGPLQGDRATGTVTARVSGLPGELSGPVTLSADGTGSTVSLDGKVEVPIPLIGGKVEAMIAERLVEILGHEEKFTAEWLATAAE